MPVLYDDSGSVYDSTLLSYDGAQARVATGSGLGAGSALAVIIRAKTATGSGVGSGTANKLRVVPRRSVSSESTYDSSSTTYDASITYDADGGSSSESASSLKISKRSLADSGVGSQTVERLIIRPRVASGSGAGTTDGVIGVRIALRTATSSGVGESVSFGGRVVSREAEGSGIGADTSLWQKSFIFRPPTEDRFPWSDYRDSSPSHRLFARANPGYRARNIFRLTTGVYTNVDPLDPNLVDKVYLGAHEHYVTEQEKADLVAAGYTVT